MGSIRKRCPEWQVRTHLPAVLLALMVAGCFAASPEMTKSGRTGVEKGKKVGTGKSFVAETMVALAPAAPPGGGWDAERVMSGQDDWEPATAVDPVNSNYVYQLTTRYTGPKPCGNCKLPAIVLRRSTDGGATWVEQFLSTTGKAQYDPQIVVATTVASPGPRVSRGRATGRSRSGTTSRGSASPGTASTSISGSTPATATSFRRTISAPRSRGR